MDVVLVGGAIAMAAFGCLAGWGNWAWARRRQATLDAQVNAIGADRSDEALALARKALDHAQRHWGHGSPPCAPPLEAIGRHYESAGDTPRAIQFYERSLNATADDEHYAALVLHLLNRLAWCHVALEEWARASERLDAIERQLKAPEDGFFARTALCRARLAREAGDLEAAEKRLLRWLAESKDWHGEHDPYRGAPVVAARLADDSVHDEEDELEDRICAYRELASTLEARGKNVEAQRWRFALLGMHERRRDEESSDYETRHLALAAEAEEEWEAAATHWQKLRASRDPGLKTTALVALGVCEQHLDRPERALESYERAFAVDVQPGFEEVHRWLCLRRAELLALRNPERALEAFEASGATSELGDRFDTSLVATAEWLCGDHESARKRVDARVALLQARSDEPSRLASEQIELGSWNATRGRLDEASRAIDAARFALDDDQARSGQLARALAAVRVSLAYYEARFDDASRIVADIAVAPGDWSAEAWREDQLATAAWMRGQLTEATRHLVRVSELTDGHRVSREWPIYVQTRAARALLLTGEVEAARSRFALVHAGLDDAIPELSYLRADAMALEGELLFAQSDFTRGEARLTRAIASVHRYCGFAPELRVRWSMLLQERSRNDEARAVATQALDEARGIYTELHPLIAFGNAVLARVARDEGDHARARELLTHAHASLEQHAHAKAPELRAELDAFTARIPGE